ncbi:hypothetical protein A3J89_01260 [Candidatus Curtissbacteria bacterium RIFOXYB12_FULL_40_6]|nr:MAG: hypothetical protein A3J89_01260 [Candidatus Curtissbacteria bacterium RIFOXYB12_FULL_40_6]
MERPIGDQTQFVPSVTFENLYGDSRLALDALEKDLGRGIKETQKLNADWAEDQLRVLRKDRREPLLDILLVDENGQILRAISTYWSYARNAQLALSPTDLAQFTVKNKKIVYPLVPQNDSALFWLARDEGRVQSALQKYFGEVEVGDYLAAHPAASEMTGSVRLAWVQKGRAGKSKFADEGIIFGNLGFWVNQKLRLGNFGPGIYVQRVRFDDSRLLPEDTYISPLDPTQVNKRGGKVMEDKYPNVRVIRVDPVLSKHDFIPLALNSSPNSEYPVVLSYTTARPWLDWVPKHGGVSS